MQIKLSLSCVVKQKQTNNTEWTTRPTMTPSLHSYTQSKWKCFVQAATTAWDAWRIIVVGSLHNRFYAKPFPRTIVYPQPSFLLIFWRTTSPDPITIEGNGVDEQLEPELLSQWPTGWWTKRAVSVFCVAQPWLDLDGVICGDTNHSGSVPVSSNAPARPMANLGRPQPLHLDLRHWPEKIGQIWGLRANRRSFDLPTKMDAFLLGALCFLWALFVWIGHCIDREKRRD